VRETREEFDEEEGEEEEEEMIMMLLVMMMMTFLHALTCTCHYIRNASFVSEVTAGILPRQVFSQCQVFESWL